MVGGLFGKKKSEEKEKEKSPAAVSPTSSVPENNDMFGGMAAKSRRKRGATTVDGPATAEAPPAEVAPPPEPSEKSSEAADEPKPFFSRFSVAQGPPIEEQEDPADAALRRRLERFYEEYNPSKLSQIDQTIKQFKGKETELFTALVTKYGPEPAELKKDNVKAKVVVIEEATLETKADSTGFGWGNNDAASADGAGGWGAASEHSAAGEWGAGQATGFTFGGNDAASATGGFGFAADAPATGGFGFTSTEEPTSGGFGFATATETTTEAAPSGFAFKSEAEETPAKGFGFATPADEAPASESEDSDDEPTLNERHRAEVRDHQGDVLESKQLLADAITQVADAIVTRQRLLATYSTVESEIDACIAKEEFERAEELNNELEIIATRTSELDDTERQGEAQIATLVAKLSSSVTSLAEMYSRHRQELLDSKVEEERRVNKYITETSSRLDTQSEKIAASLDRANRTLHNTEQEVMNIEQRHQKLQEKIGEQTKGLRDTLSTTTKEKETLDNEIRDLEAKLQLKRRQSAEKKLQLSELSDKLKIIMDDFAETVDEVSRQLKDETLKRCDAQAVVDDITQQEEQLLREQKRFHEDRDGMLSSLQQNHAKIERYHVIAAEMATDVPLEISNYVKATVQGLFAARAPGRSVLAANPSATAEGPLAPLRQMEAKLRQLELDLQSNQATEASLTVRLQDSRKSLPLLEAAKKAAAQAKQFKEAQAKTEEIKRLGEDAAECEIGLQSARTSIESLKEDIACTHLSIERESKNAAASIAEFKNRYVSSLTQSARFRAATQLNVLRLDAEELTNDDDLANACEALHHALTLEASTLPTDGDATVEDIIEEDTRVESETDDAHPAVVEDNDAEVDPEEHEEISVEELQSKLAEAEEELASAVEAENYELCDEIQSRIDALQVKIDASA